jgi:hypothetical protein
MLRDMKCVAIGATGVSLLNGVWFAALKNVILLNYTHAGMTGGSSMGGGLQQTAQPYPLCPFIIGVETTNL